MRTPTSMAAIQQQPNTHLVLQVEVRSFHNGICLRTIWELSKCLELFALVDKVHLSAINEELEGNLHIRRRPSIYWIGAHGWAEARKNSRGLLKSLASYYLAGGKSFEAYRSPSRALSGTHTVRKHNEKIAKEEAIPSD